MQRGKLRQLIHLDKTFFVSFDDSNASIMRATVNTVQSQLRWPGNQDKELKLTLCGTHI